MSGITRRRFLGGAATAAGSMLLGGCLGGEEEYTPVDAADLEEDGLEAYAGEDIETEMYVVKGEEKTIYVQELSRGDEELVETEAVLYDAYDTLEDAESGEGGFAALEYVGDPEGLPVNHRVEEGEVVREKIGAKGQVERFYDEADGSDDPTYVFEVHEAWR